MSAEALARPAAAVRRLVGGVVDWPDRFAGTRLERALGPAASFAGEWDVCGVDCDRLGEADGAFAVAWRDGAGAVHLARDGVGERSLYYATSGGGVAFASTVAPLVAARVVAPRLNRQAVAAYLAYGYVPGRDTLVEGIHEVLPGEHVVVDGGVVRRTSFWQLPPEDAEPDGEDAYRDELRALLERAVLRRIGDVDTVGATLSGGIDSSLVLALARRLHDGPVTAYSLSFGRRVPNELAFAALAASHVGVTHRIIDLSLRAVIDRFDATMGALSNPIGEPLTVANTLLFEAAAHEGVVLNGEGGDPCFGGPKNVPMLLREIYDGPEARARSFLRAHGKCFDDLDRALTFPYAPLEPAVAEHLSDDRRPALVNRLTALNIRFKGSHHILPKVDHLSRLAGATARSPLFDRAVVDAAVRMPADLKLRGSTEKHVLKLAVADLLPREILDRPKRGMRVPVERWLDGRFHRFARERLLDGLTPWDLVRRDYLERLVDPGDVGVAHRGAKVWLLLSLESWLREVLR